MMIPTSKNVTRYIIESGAIRYLQAFLSSPSENRDASVVFCIDHFFRNHEILQELPRQAKDCLFFIDTSDEPKTKEIDILVQNIHNECSMTPSAVVGIGGGSTLDTAKAISNLLTNPGRASDYQGWDLVKKPGVFKIGVPTISGTGAETSRTCVMTNPENGLKLGMNSEFSVFDVLLLDPNLTASVPRDQYFFTGTDTYIHCIESLRGRRRHPLADAFSEKALQMSRQVFLEGDMMSPPNREKLMVASYLGGSAIANSFVGVVHPFSAGLSVVLGLHHGVANCIAMASLEEFYPEETAEFQRMLSFQKVSLPQNVCKHLSHQQFEQLYHSTIIHEKPLKNALGESFKEILSPEKVATIFQRM